MNRPLARTLEIRTSPHVVSGYAVETIMGNVLLALAPATLFGLWAFGTGAALVLATAIASCLLAERIAGAWIGRRGTLGDYSAAVTGLLYGLTLPPSLPLWMVVVGGLISIWIGKSLFGGLGANPFNPALVGRAVMQATFPVPMTTWIVPFAADRFTAIPASVLALPFTRPAVDATTAATPLSLWKFSHQPTGEVDLALGLVGGSLGETSAVLLLAGGLWLVARNLMSWRIPVAIFAVVAGGSAALHLHDPARYASAGFMLFSGGLMLGALFMATDMVTAPVTQRGRWAYGALIGALVVLIRVWGGMPEGVMYAILLGNAAAPQFDRMLESRVFGTVRRKGAA